MDRNDTIIADEIYRSLAKEGPLWIVCPPPSLSQFPVEVQHLFERAPT